MPTEATAAVPESTPARNHRWGVILAGGDGTRLLPYTRRLTGDDRPKQFCSLMGPATLIRQTRERISPLVRQDRTVLVLNRAHERWFDDNPDGLLPEHCLVQPCNFDTAPAILYSLNRIYAADPHATAGIFPSDHYFADNAAFVAHMEAAWRAVSAQPERILLLGIVPDSPDPGLGWIEPGEMLCDQPPGPISRVAQFWEKPSPDLALDLMMRGCLWNSFVMVAKAGTMLAHIRLMLPRLSAAFEALRPAFGTWSEADALSRLYSSLRPVNFSREVLSSHPYDSVQPVVLGVMRGANLGWSDLGEPGRVLSAIERRGARSEGRTHDYAPAAVA